MAGDRSCEIQKQIHGSALYREHRAMCHATKVNEKPSMTGLKWVVMLVELQIIFGYVRMIIYIQSCISNS